MIHTIHNPKLVEKHFNFNGIKTFTGVVKDKRNNFFYYLNGKLHREDGPAITCTNGNLYWYSNGKPHRINGPALECTNGFKAWYLNGKCYGLNNKFTHKSWIKFNKLLLLK